MVDYKRALGTTDGSNRDDIVCFKIPQKMFTASFFRFLRTSGYRNWGGKWRSSLGDIEPKEAKNSTEGMANRIQTEGEENHIGHTKREFTGDCKGAWSVGCWGRGCRLIAPSCSPQIIT